MTRQRHLDARKPDYKRLCILAPLKRDRRWLLGDLLINYLTKQRKDLLRFFTVFVLAWVRTLPIAEILGGKNVRAWVLNEIIQI